MLSRRPFCFRASAAVEFVIPYVHGSFLPLNLGLVFSCLPKSQWTFYFLLSNSAQSYQGLDELSTFLCTRVLLI